MLNAGDDLLQHSLTWLFREHHLTFTRTMPQQDTIQQFDLLVIGGGSLWPQHAFFALGDEYARSLRIPYMVLGVSARSYDADAVRKTRIVIENAAFFQVRDTQTAKWLDHPKVHIGTDLFWTTPWFGDTKAATTPPDGIAFAPRSSVAAEWPVQACLNALAPFGQVTPWPFFYGHPKYDGANLSDAELLQKEMADVPPSFSFDPLFASSAVFTMRYHGILCALRAGRPALVGDVHTKLGSFCAEHGLTSWHVDGMAALPSKARELARNLAAERNAALAVREQLLRAGQTLSATVRARTAAVPVRKMTNTRRLMVNGLRNILSRIS